MEERERAKRIFEATFGETDPAPSVVAPEEDSDIDISRGKRRRVKLDALLTDALKKGGYRRVAKLTYRADWSADDVEHVLSAAYVAFLAAKLGRARSVTRDVLTKHSANILGGIDRERLTLDAFIDSLLDDAEAAVAANKAAP